MISCLGLRNAWLVGIACLLLILNACAMMQRPEAQREPNLSETAGLIEEVKAFGKTLGIEPTEALSRTSAGDRALSMLWFWLQKAGTLAVAVPMDIRMAVGFDAAKERVPVEQVYRVDGYSVYYRQANEYADPRSAATPSFAAQGVVRRVTVILHEDLHGDTNFDLPWDIEEAVVTPLGALTAVEYFKRKEDAENLRRSQTALNEGRQISRELHELVQEAREKIIALLPRYPAYHSMFQRQTAGQHPPTVLEAKLSHDLVYFRYFNAIADLAEAPTGLKALIAELKKLPRNSTLASADEFLRSLSAKYSAPTN